MSSSECTEHKFYDDTHQILFPKKSMIRDIDHYMPPRKLLTRLGGAKTAIHDVADMFTDSPRFSSSDETLLRKFLPHNNLADESDDNYHDPYSSEHFRMYEFKVRRCNRSRSHDWTDCPFAHPGEKARRRDPRKYHYSGTICAEYRRSGACRRGDSCEFAHGVFECWLHPARYRTESCKDGKNCKRKVCFFAHTPHQLRILPLNCSSSLDQISDKKNKFLKPSSMGSNNCCMFCHRSANTNSSPTSTLFGMSHFSPPLSPSSSPVSPIETETSANGLSPISRYSERIEGSEACNNNQAMVMSYGDALTELMSSLEVLNFNESSSPEISATTNNKSPNLHWLDASCFNCDDQFIPSPSASFNCENQQQMILSSSSQQISQNPTALSASRKFSTGKNFNESRIIDDDNGSSCATPDLGWVNDLLI